MSERKKTNEETENAVSRILEIFTASEGAIRPHFILTGPSGAGKSYTINTLAEKFEVNFFEVNAAQLTKEGLSGLSLSKALTPLKQCHGSLTICFVDEFDKLFISGNSNSQLAHESTTGVQNEFLKVLENGTTSVFDDYGKYVDVPTDKVLFVFAGAFNGEEEIDIDRLRAFGIKTEFLGRVGLVYNLVKLTLLELKQILENSPILEMYLSLFPEAKKEKVVNTIMKVVEDNYEKNTLGVRVLNTMLNKYFIEGGKLEKEKVEQVVFRKQLRM